MNYEYKMIPVPRTIVVKAGEDMSAAVAGYLTELVNSMSEQGWEFYRTDEYSVAEVPGRLGILCGKKEIFENYNVVCFRRSKQF